ncbi:MAG: hypothetical protein CM15mP102_10200 [Flavobacteriales bacterium]|nr:MAG: hypothetical protein CM15mP102_10200 [Flavobacteriales bacterium]
MERLLMIPIMHFMIFVKNYFQKIILVIIGGSNDIIYPIFKSYDSHNEKSILFL